MRLKSIKLAGFKSFVDPTNVPLPSNMCGVVGPNGCGKSNIIDAVRWVMGESSAKNLRGESMTDVIFNGSNARKPVGQASVELIFDNNDGSLVGEYAKYSEISVKRRVTRDGKNQYFLNGTKCRRKDITDIFLGTGLGPRSYAIISQGIISNLIESKPEELRVFIEEAAGISKYKERRRETENRIRRTTENLERLTDLREELERQLHHLHRQAQAAEKYKAFKEEERLKKAQLQGLRWRTIHQQVEAKKQLIGELEVKLEAEVAGQRSQDSAIEKQRELHTTLTDQFNEVQGRYYSIGAEVARIEQSIQHAKARLAELQQDLQANEKNLQEANTDLVNDQQLQGQLKEELAEITPELELLSAAEEESAISLQSSEEAMQNWQNNWDQFNQRSAEPKRKAEVEQSRIQHLEQVLKRLHERIHRLEEEQQGLSAGPLEEEIALLQEQQSEFELNAEAHAGQMDDVAQSIESYRQQEQQLVEALDQLRSELQQARGRFASLEALQQAAMGDNDETNSWVAEVGLAEQTKLAEQLSVTPGWETALETVLGDCLQAIVVDQLAVTSEQLATLKEGTVTLLEPQSQQNTVLLNGKTPLLSVVNDQRHVASMLSGIYLTETLPEALAQRHELSPHESVVCREGVWVGPNWLRVAKGDNAQAGILKRKQELENLANSIDQLETTIAANNQQLTETQEQHRTAELQRDQLQHTLAELNRQQGECKAALSGKQVKVEQILERRTRVLQELEELASQQHHEQQNISEARLLLQEALDLMADDEGQREQLLASRDEIRAALDQARQQARYDKDKSHQLALRQQSLTTQLQSIEQGLNRLTSQVARFTEQQSQLKETVAQTELPLAEWDMELETQLERRIQVEDELANARRELETVDHEIRQYEKLRSGAEQQATKIRSALEQQRIDWQGLTVRLNTLQEQLQAEQFDLEQVIAELPEDADENVWTDALEKIANKIQRLGAINLAAIEEYEVQSERKRYLDAQNEDLQEALNTLEDAIRKIDKETRNRFKSTFDKVNSGLQTLFPKVFGGGSAYLELTGEDLLDTGVAIMARPPGKKNSTIHLLSGGEKALTAIALVFSIFQLNPAPFCMLDEVDAPLDDANVGRYARMVTEMSKSVQFIYITHNKIAMEAASHLMGVTMQEPGVSRLVAVDVEAAAALAAL
ncbi:chromosome segregation protein SMC [Spartinivicinus ruber]|uniref:chromosome segregation protein SMC n=1 Tax=Spartinivicinus ruber TaxID=2683272 RepID=UPI0013D22789|nr:chromosome segregation protein SMC [Spartinivicinus ruber]